MHRVWTISAIFALDSFPVASFPGLQKWKGAGPFYHMLSTWVGRRGGGVARSNEKKCYLVVSAPKCWSFECSWSEEHTTSGSKWKTRVQNAFFRHGKAWEWEDEDGLGPGLRTDPSVDASVLHVFILEAIFALGSRRANKTNVQVTIARLRRPGYKV